ncbi:MAG: putative manganese transporter [Candidatus Gastranaerophilaceae bacterium]
MLTDLLNRIPEFAADAIADSINLLPFLFIIFVFIELFEHYFSKKIVSFLRYSKKIGPVIGAVCAIVPQCGFSIVASVLYVKRFISVGTLIAIYIATSDEAIPIIIAEPSGISEVLKIIAVKLFLAIFAGYLTDFIFKPKSVLSNDDDIDAINEKGCCNHEISGHKILEILWHPVKHTFIIFLFILAVCLGLNYMFEIVPQTTIEKFLLQDSVLQPVAAGIFGLIPNCAVSVLITMMFLKGAISFGSVISGLSSSAGLGLLVLLRKNSEIKDTVLIISILLTVSIAAGILIQLF